MPRLGAGLPEELVQDVGAGPGNAEEARSTSPVTAFERTRQWRRLDTIQVMSAAGPIRVRARRAAGAVFVWGFGLFVFWPGQIVALPSTVVAAFGGGRPGVFVAEQSMSGKSELWRGRFRSDDGTVLLPDVTVSPGFGNFTAGQAVPATYMPLPDVWWVPGSEVHPRSGSTDWAYPAVVTAVWTGLLAWAALRLRRMLLPPERALRPAPRPPACSCADPDRCDDHGRRLGSPDSTG